jgi:hypothetical protein
MLLFGAIETRNLDASDVWFGNGNGHPARTAAVGIAASNQWQNALQNTKAQVQPASAIIGIPTAWASCSQSYTSQYNSTQCIDLAVDQMSDRAALCPSDYFRASALAQCEGQKIARYALAAVTAVCTLATSPMGSLRVSYALALTFAGLACALSLGLQSAAEDVPVYLQLFDCSALPDAAYFRAAAPSSQGGEGGNNQGQGWTPGLQELVRCWRLSPNQALPQQQALQAGSFSQFQRAWRQPEEDPLAAALLLRLRLLWVGWAVCAACLLRAACRHIAAAAAARGRKEGDGAEPETAPARGPAGGADVASSSMIASM